MPEDVEGPDIGSYGKRQTQPNPWPGKHKPHPEGLAPDT